MNQAYNSYSVKDFGAQGDGTTDDTSAIQAAIDSLGAEGGDVIFPETSTSYRISTIKGKQNGTRLIGLGGRVELKSNVTATDADSAMITFLKDVDHSSQNYQDVLIDGFVINGDNVALYGVHADGFTFRCQIRNTRIKKCVCHLWVDDGFYSNYTNVGFDENPKTKPTTVSTARWADRRHSAHFSVCNATSLRDITWQNIGGGSGNSYSAILYMDKSDSVSLNGAIEQSTEALGDYVTNGIYIDDGSLKISSLYIESVQTSGDFFKLNNGVGSMWDSSDMYIKNLTAPVLFGSPDDSPIVLTNTFARDLTISDRLFKLSVGKIFYNVQFFGLTCFRPPTATTEGLWCDPIATLNNGEIGATGYIQKGFNTSISTSYIRSRPSGVVVNGQNIWAYPNDDENFDLAPDLTGSSANWNVKVSPAGTTYVEKQGSEKSGSTYALTIATFSTPGSGGNPTGMTKINLDIPTLANNATPSVLRGNTFITGGTTTITDFDDGFTGKIIRIIAEHSLTITDGTNIFLNGSVDFSMNATNTLTLVQKSNGLWYELARSDNTI
jgi:hypothetical protein